MHCVEAMGLSKIFRGSSGSVKALDEVSICANAGSITALLGPNGAGKSTLVRIILGLIRPDSGSVLVSGESPFERRGVLKSVGSLLDGTKGLYGRLTVLENLLYFAALKGVSVRVARSRCSMLLELMGLAERRDVLAQELSRGMQQRVATISAFVHSPTVIVLDEPTLGLDSESVKFLQAILEEERAKGAAILLSSHHFDWIEQVAESVILLRDGVVVSHGNTRELIAQYQSDGYVVNSLQDLPEFVLDSLRGLCTVKGPRTMSVFGGVSGLHAVLDLIRNFELHSISRVDSSLSAVINRALQND